MRPKVNAEDTQTFHDSDGESMSWASFRSSHLYYVQSVILYHFRLAPLPAVCALEDDSSS